MINKLKQMGQNTSNRARMALGLLFVLVLADYAYISYNNNDIISSAVKITNLKGNSGGSGAILSSSDGESIIITNSHVCRVVENGGLVHSNNNSYYVDSYKHSNNHDLCLIKVLDNLRVGTRVAKNKPVNFYEQASISGHPSLLPTVVTKGHFSGKEIITVLVDMKKCTKEDLENPDNIMFCMFFGGIPVLKNYVSTLVTATIMPGSSGSGVYDSNNDLTGLAFAGSGNLGYAWTVPYEYLRLFLDLESKKLPFIKTKSEQFASSKDESATYRVYKSCVKNYSSAPDEVRQICDLVRKDLIWRQK